MTGENSQIVPPPGSSVFYVVTSAEADVTKAEPEHSEE